MANKDISMTITAKDRFTKTFDALQRRINAVQAPLRRFQARAQRMDRVLGLARGRQATHGFAPEAVAQFKALGLSFDEMKSLSPDKMFEHIAARLRQIKDPVAQLIAAQKVFGAGVAGILPILQQTGKAYEDNIKKAERYGVLNDKGIAAASRLAQAQKDLKLAAEGFQHTGRNGRACSAPHHPVHGGMDCGQPAMDRHPHHRLHPASRQMAE